MMPDEIAADGEVSADVCTVTVLLPLVIPPMVSPPTVIMNADAEIAAPEVVMTKED